MLFTLFPLFYSSDGPDKNSKLLRKVINTASEYCLTGRRINAVDMEKSNAGLWEHKGARL